MPLSSRKKIALERAIGVDLNPRVEVYQIK